MICEAVAEQDLSVRTVILEFLLFGKFCLLSPYLFFSLNGCYSFFLCDLIQSNLALFHAISCNHRSVKSLGCTIGAKTRPTKGGPLEKEVSDRRYIHFHRLCPGWIHQQH